MYSIKKWAKNNGNLKPMAVKPNMLGQSLCGGIKDPEGGGQTCQGDFRISWQSKLEARACESWRAPTDGQ